MEVAYIPESRAIITGYRGYIGSTLLKDHEFEVVSLERLSNPSIIIHLAHRVSNAVSDFSNNLTLDTMIFEFCKKNNTPLVYASTNNVYPIAPSCAPSTPYAYNDYYSASKIVSESLLRYFYTFSFAILRIGDVFGAHQRHGNFFKALAHCLVSKTPFTLQGDGSKTRSYIYISDLVTLLEFLIRSPDSLSREIYNIGYQQAMSLRDILEFFSAYAQLEVIHIPQAPSPLAPDIRTMEFTPIPQFSYHYDMHQALKDYYGKICRRA